MFTQPTPTQHNTTSAISTLTFVPHRDGYSHDHDGHSNSRGEDPDADIDDLCLGGGAEVQRLHWVAHGDVPVHTHHCEGEDAGEHVVVVDGDDQLAEQLSKGPGVHQVFRTLKGQRAGG